MFDKPVSDWICPTNGATEAIAGRRLIATINIPDADSKNERMLILFLFETPERFPADPVVSFNMNHISFSGNCEATLPNEFSSQNTQNKENSRSTLYHSFERP
ncbi:hypothetical protein [Actinopolyspora alba]|uniref:hypothetical protein n=1 Tax=Actinopolyspora alba TaxID=673379 RepID=UPI001C318AB0|nr:hypothetical protein [Actinopolyspora alba]